MLNPTKEIKLNEGDSLKILLESKEFLFQCCDCGLVHKVKINHKQNDVLLTFFREE